MSTNEYLPAEFTDASAQIRPLKSQADETADRAKAWTEMNPELKAAAQKLREMSTDTMKSGLLRMWALGKYIREIRNNEKKYDLDPISKIRRALGYATFDILNKAERMYEWMPDDAKFQDLVNKRTRIGGDTIGYHRIAKMMLAPQDKQDFLVKQTVENDWTVDEVGQAVDKLNDEEDTKNAGSMKTLVANVNNSAELPDTKSAPTAVDNPKTPKELRAAHSRKGKAGRTHKVHWRETARIQEMTNPIGQLERKLKAVLLSDEHGLATMSASIPADKITPEAFTNLDQLIETTRSLEETLKMVRVEAESCKKQWQTRANQQAQQDATKTADAMATKIKKKSSHKTTVGV